MKTLHPAVASPNGHEDSCASTWGFILTAFRSFDGQSLLLVSEDRNISPYVAER